MAGIQRVEVQPRTPSISHYYVQWSKSRPLFREPPGTDKRCLAVYWALVGVVNMMSTTSSNSVKARCELCPRVSRRKLPVV